MSNKVARFFRRLAPIMFASFCALAVCAQESTGQGMKGKPEHKAAHSATSVTGCLQKGEEPSGFYISTEDGKTWELRSSKVELADHVGHQVTVSGTPTHGSKQRETKVGASEEKEAGGKEHADLRVTTLKMVSESCSK